MWDEEDGFFYDLLRLPDGSAQRLKVRSMVGLLPLCASTVYGREIARSLPRFVEAGRAGSSRNAPSCSTTSRRSTAPATRAGGSSPSCDETKLERILSRMLDAKEFLSDYGIRALSRVHLDAPLPCPRRTAKEFSVGYLPAESDTGMFGGNSNWRGRSGCRSTSSSIRAAPEPLRATTATT